MSTLIGVLARDPRKSQLDCFDWRKMEQQKKDSLWQEVKVRVHRALICIDIKSEEMCLTYLSQFILIFIFQCSFCFPNGTEPYEWAMEKMHACQRGYKSELKMEHFDSKSQDEAVQSKSTHIPPDTYDNLGTFWESDKGKVIATKTSNQTFSYC